MAQSVEQLICNLQVMGSSPFTSSRKKQKALTENSVRAFLFESIAKRMIKYLLFARSHEIWQREIL